MGLVTNVLFGPAKLLAWTASQILEVAEGEWYDEHDIGSALAALNEDYDRGLIDDEGFLAAEDALMERLEVARARGAS